MSTRTSPLNPRVLGLLVSPYSGSDYQVCPWADKPWQRHGWMRVMTMIMACRIIPMFYLRALRS